MAGCWGGSGVWTVDNNTWRTKQEVIQQLLDQWWTWRKESDSLITVHILLKLCDASNRCSPRCSFSLPQSESKVLMRRRCPANRMLSDSLVSISELQLGSKLSSQEISSSSMVAGLTFKTSISEARVDIDRTPGIFHITNYFIFKCSSYDRRGNFSIYWLGHPEVDIGGQSTPCTVKGTWNKKAISVPLLQFQSCLSCAILVVLPLVDSSHYRRGTP